MRPILLFFLCLPALIAAIEVNLDNETEFWLDILEFAKDNGVGRSSLKTLINSWEQHEKHDDHHESHGIKVASWKFDYVKEPLMLTLFIIVIGLFKLGYHHSGMLQTLVPESCALILVGVGCGLVFIGDTTHESIRFLEFNSKTFFFFLLPPIILEAAYSLKDKAFIENIGTIVIYAVVGTIMNIALIGGFLIFFSEVGMMGSFRIGPLDCLLFASLIAAVDPVLAIFQEVGVNKMLYFMVFGESLLNDAVTVVCYNLVSEFKELPEFRFIDILLGLAAFLCVSLGGLLIGLLCGLLSALITRYTEHVRVVEPVVLFGMAYLAYMGSELFHFSGIIGIIACGLFQSHYSCSNIASKSYISVTYFTKVSSAVAESLIFIVLGVMLVNEKEWFWEDWHPLFSFYSVLLCIVVRAAVVFFLTYIINRFTGGVRFISLQEQFIMAYGGLRGAVSFSLAFMISNDVAVKDTLLSATYMVILFTVFVQGMTIKPLVRFFNIRLAQKEDNFYMFMEFNRGMVAHLSQGIELICGYKDYGYVAVLTRWSRKYVRPLLEKNYQGKRQREGKLVEMDRTATVREAIRANASTSSFKRVEELMENGEISKEMLEEEETFLTSRRSASVCRKEKEEIEKKTTELTKGHFNIRKLLRNPLNEFYNNKNLVGEEEKEKKMEQAIHNMRQLHRRAHGIADPKRRSLMGLGRKSTKRKKNTQQGLIMAAMGSLGVHAMNASHKEDEQCSSSPPEDDFGLLMAREDSEHQLYTINEAE